MIKDVQSHRTRAGPPCVMSNVTARTQHEAELSGARVASSNLRAKARKIPVEETLRAKSSQQPRPSFG
jgi:hypothetical protein